MDIKKLELNLQKEKENYKKYAAKAQKAKEKIESLEALIYTKKFSEATDVVQQKGLTLDELMAAVQRGDFSSLQERINQNQSGEEKNEESDFHSESSY